MAEKSEQKSESLEDIKKLPTEQRIKKLKELASKRQQEIEEAQKLLKVDEEELRQKKNLEEKVPIPQVAADFETLTTYEEREMIRAHRPVSQKQKTPALEKDQTKEENLEDAIERTPISKIPNAAEYGQIAQLSQRPIEYFRSLFEDVTRQAYTLGGIHKLDEEARKKFMYASMGWDAKVQAIEREEYEPTKDAFKNAVLTERLRDKLQSMYHTQTFRQSKEEEERSRYKT